MIVYTHCTPSHRPLRDEFLAPSAQRCGLPLVVYGGEQIAEGGRFAGARWIEAMVDKARSMQRAALEAPDGAPYIWADCDVQFLQPCADRLVELLGDCDLAAQAACEDVPLSAGFYIARATAATRALMAAILEHPALQPGFTRHKMSDQTALNALRELVRWRVLPRDEVFTVGAVALKPWRGQPFRVPRGVLVHHADHCVGVDKKAELLRYVARNARPY